MTALPRRTDPVFALYYDDIDRLRYGIGGAKQRLSRTTLLDLTDTAALAATHLLDIANVGTDSLYSAHGTDAMTHSIRCQTAAGTDFYIMCTQTATNRDDGE